jgi:hypothetical protein
MTVHKDALPYRITFTTTLQNLGIPKRHNCAQRFRAQYVSTDTPSNRYKSAVVGFIHHAYPDGAHLSSTHEHHLQHIQ